MVSAERRHRHQAQADQSDHQQGQKHAPPILPKRAGPQGRSF
jgi:hypothetical protein